MTRASLSSSRRFALVATLLVLAGCAGRDQPAPVEFRGDAPAIALPAGAREIVVERGDTLYAISRRNNVPLRALIEANHLQPPYTIYPGNRLVLPARRVHVVRQNETLYGISRAYDVEMSALAQANGLKQPFIVTPGMQLVVPEGQGAATDAAAAAVAAAGPEGRPPSTRIGEPEILSVSPAVGGPPSSVAAASGTTTVSGAGITATTLPPPDIDAGTTISEAGSPAGDTMRAAGEGPVALTPAVPPSAAPGTDPSTTVPPPVTVPAAQDVPPAQPSPTATDLTATEPAAPATAPAAATPPVPEKPAEVVAPPPAATAPPIKAKPVDVGDLGPAPKRFVWPVNGRVVSGYGDKAGGLHNDGVNIQAPRGTPIRAAADGVVVYSGSDLKGFGNMLLIRHGGNWLTAYAHAQAVLVDRGQRVKQGEVIARVGSSGNVDQPQLHFELRRGREAVDPERYLPRR
ncbi:peptidoglycan DD-metalloendopeptidase family protein [Tistrella bauzanensis]|uniref:peptidoglycan DD-metalloendopeptidase family protein n=1 Tax=Tistrella bauzanensis TaxID=657419 RepID=UPI00166AC590|nr:peptidoglycan DD-metalloendopeptidase family protein [Tistrella bauzanensis]